MTTEELRGLEKEVASRMHDLVEDRLPAAYKEIPELAQGALEACQTWADINDKLKAAKKAAAA